MKYIQPQQEPRIKREPLTEDLFHQYHTQNWIDVLLQTYKYMSLARIESPAKSAIKMNHNTTAQSAGSSATRVTALSVLSLMITKSLERTLVEIGKNIFSEEEIILLAWLSQHFTEKCSLLWPDNEAVTLKKVENFTNDLSDSIVLTAVTASHCPYLMRYLQDMYVLAETCEQKWHNATRLILAWEKINISFKVAPEDIETPVALQMIMLVHHLHEVLPHLHPAEMITLEAPITQEIEKKFEVENKSDATVMYEALIFNNEKNHFSIEPSVLKIPPKKSGVVSIKYHAKYLSRCRCTLVLSGDTQGYKYAKALSYYLEGVPNPNYFNSEIVFTPSLYHYEETSVKVVSPYPEAAVYNVYIKTDAIEQSVDELTLVPYEEMMKSNVPSFVFQTANTLYCDEHGNGVCHLIVNPVIPANMEFHVFMVNNDVGTFSVKLKIATTKKRVHYEVVDAVLPRGFSSFECICTDGIRKLDCPKMISIEVSCKNNLLWSCIERSFMTRLDESELRFWKKYFGKHIFLVI